VKKLSGKKAWRPQKKDGGGVKKRRGEKGTLTLDMQMETAKGREAVGNRKKVPFEERDAQNNPHQRNNKCSASAAPPYE